MLGLDYFLLVLVNAIKEGERLLFLLCLQVLLNGVAPVPYGFRVQSGGAPVVRRHHQGGGGGMGRYQ